LERDDNLSGKTVHGSYAIISILGEGGMGRVYLAENVLVRDRKYAVKVLKRELTRSSNFKKQFDDEAAHQAQVSHPNIIEMFDYFKEGEDYFLVLPYIEGQSLADKIDSLHGQPMVEKEALRIIKDVLAALNCAHQKAILHRDIKASNVMVDKSGRTFVLDFGIARQAGDQQAASLGRVIGTPEYMSPEQFIDSDKVDHRSDVYSTGILLFEMLTGKLPFQGGSQLALKEQHLGAPVPNPRILNPKIKKKLAEIVLKATQKDPGARFQGCLDFLKAIESYERARSWKIFGLSLSILLAAAIWYLTQNEKAIRSLATLSSDKYALFCQESERLRIKEAGLEIAKKTGNSQFVEELSKQVKDLNTNVIRYLGDYINAIQDLSDFRNAKVQQIFTEPENISGPEQAGYNAVDKMMRAKFWLLARKSYEDFINMRKSPSRESMQEECPR
jgi:serine/threonine protein kinase